MSELHDSELYQAATNSLASDVATNNTYEKVINAACAATDVDLFKHTMYEVEELIKTEYGLSKMPGPWRSAKSVVTRCLELGISFLDENGNTKGKSRLQGDIRAKVMETKEDEKDPFNKCLDAMDKLSLLFALLSDSEKKVIKDSVTSWS